MAQKKSRTRAALMTQKRTSAHRKEPQAFAALSCRTAADYRDLGVVSSLSAPLPGTEVLSRSIVREVPNRYA